MDRSENRTDKNLRGLVRYTRFSRGYKCATEQLCRARSADEQRPPSGFLFLRSKTFEGPVAVEHVTRAISFSMTPAGKGVPDSKAPFTSGIGSVRSGVPEKRLSKLGIGFSVVRTFSVFVGAVGFSLACPDTCFRNRGGASQDSTGESGGEFSGANRSRACSVLPEYEIFRQAESPVFRPACFASAPRFSSKVGISLSSA